MVLNKCFLNNSAIKKATWLKAKNYWIVLRSGVILYKIIFWCDKKITLEKYGY